MDPDANLKEQRELVKKILYSNPDNLDGTEQDRLAELVEGLDQWITHGGFLPAAWTKGE